MIVFVYNYLLVVFVQLILCQYYTLLLLMLLLHVLEDIAFDKQSEVGFGNIVLDILDLFIAL